MTSARWQNRKPQTILSPWTHKINNTQTNSLCKKSRNQLKGSCNPSKYETSSMEASRKIGSTSSPEPHPVAQRGATRRKFPTPGLSLKRGRKDWNISLMLSISERLPKLVSVLPESKHWQVRAPAWMQLRTKAMVWTSTYSLAIALLHRSVKNE